MKKIFKIFIVLIIITFLYYGFIKKGPSLDDYIEKIREEGYTETNVDDNIKVDISYTNEYNDEVLKLKNDNKDSFLKYLNDFNVDFKYKDYYEIDKVLEKEQKQTGYNHNHEDLIELKDGKIDKNILLDRVKKNNSTYRDTLKSGSLLKSQLKDIEDDKLEYYIGIITDTLNYEIENSTLDLDNLRCVLANLKVFNVVSTSFAYVNEDDLLAISPNMLKLTEALYKEQDALRDILSHEAMHLIQKGCKHNNNDNLTIVGFSKKWEDLDVNSLYFRWFYEGAAEKLMTTYTKDVATTYKYIIGYLESLTTSILLKNNVTPTTIENISFSKDIKDLYDLLDVKNENDKKEIIEMMYTLDVLQFAREDFYSKYGEMKKGDELILFQQELKVSVCEVFTKLFYKNLSTYIANNSIKTDDLFYLIRLFESDINNHLDMNNEKKKEISKIFIEDYTKVQDEFFKEIAQSNKKTLENIKNQFNLYSFSINKEKTLNSLDNLKREYYFRKHEEVKKYSTNPINRY